MGEFGADFDLQAFKAAFDSTTDMDSYNRAQVIEHSYVKVPAGHVHEAVELILSGAREFIGPYRDWVEEYLG
ncbi:MAG: hypothetical protein H0X42_02530 [Solirubrobacterales bacterium]|nr:hypothetical protein [Solirubrobacterales bacterium]